MFKFLARALFVISLLYAIFAGLFPFDFGFPTIRDAQEMTRQFWDWNPPDPGHTDRIQNVLFLMPLAFSAAAMSSAGRKRRAVASISIATIAAFAVSSSIEFLQSFVSFRDPSVADVWCNTLGGAIAGVIYALIGGSILKMLATQLARLRPIFGAKLIAALAVIYAAIHLAAPIHLRTAGDLSVWDRAMPVVVGNEMTGDRNWSGAVSDIFLSDRAATARQIEQLAAGTMPEELLDDSLLLHYKPRGAGPYPDLTGHESPLIWSTKISEVPAYDAVAVVPNHWLHSRENISSAVDRIRTSSQFTLATFASTFKPAQLGPARVVSISRDPWVRNIQLGQENGDLIVRVRTAVAVMPDLYVRNVFDQPQKLRHIAITHESTQIIVYIDGSERGRFEITPEAKVIWRLYPRSWFRVRIEHYGFRSYAIIYRAIVFVPFAGLIFAAVNRTRWQTRKQKLIGGIVVICLVVLIEIVLAAQAASAFQPRNWVASIVLGLGTLALLFALRKESRPIHEQNLVVPEVSDSPRDEKPRTSM